MNKALSSIFLVIIAFIVFIFGCQTSPEPIIEEQVAEEEPVEEEPVVEEAPEEPVEEPEEEPPPEPEEEPVTEVEQEEPVEEEPVAEEIQETAEFVVSEEVYTETFEDIRGLIGELNSIIRSENYSVWLGYLTNDYKSHFSSAEVLKENSDQPLLRKYNISLRSLEDYFKYVVVPSRSNARLDDLVFIDNEHVKAIMVVKDRITILYQLELVNGVWKIGR